MARAPDDRTIRSVGMSSCCFVPFDIATKAAREAEMRRGSKTSKPRVRDAIVGQVLRRQGRRPFLSHRISESAVDGFCRLSSYHFVQLLGVADYCNVFKKKMALCQGCYEAGKMYDSGFREGRVQIQDGKETFSARLVREKCEIWLL